MTGLHTVAVKLSVVIPTFNTAEMTLVCCASVMASLPADAEVIVVDDASSDDTVRQIRDGFPEIVVLRQPRNRGFSSSANLGAAASRGELIVLLNSDTRVAPGTFDAFIDAFDRDRAMGVAGAQLVNADGSPQWSAGPVPTVPWLLVMVSGAASLLQPFRRGRGSTGRDVGWVSGAAMMFRRRTWDVAGPFREDVRFYAQDLDFCVRARRGGWAIRFLKDVRVEHRHGATIAHGAALRYAPDLLWLDLLTWARGEYGAAWARRARRGMIVAAWLRIAARRLGGRDAEVTKAFVRGYEALRTSPS
jgi:N-acetylglucosaminyl-diphospho-decaprenol L-rhamnosyltransferase